MSTEARRELLLSIKADLDGVFGDGYAQQNPALVAAMIAESRRIANDKLSTAIEAAGEMISAGLNNLGVLTSG